MTSHIDFRTMPSNVPSLCIPRVFTNIDERRIRRIFDELNMGEIQRIDVVGKTTEKGEKFNRVFVHFKRWFANENADTARERLLNGKEIKIIYDDPWFWKVSAYREGNKAPRHPSFAGEKPTHKKASLQFDSDEDRPARTASKNTDEFGRDRRPQQDDRRPRPQRPRDDRRPAQRPRDDSRERQHVPRSPSNSPPRQRVLDIDTPQDGPVVINYGNCPIPVKKRNLATKKPLKIETEETQTIKHTAEEKEEGEI
jgi:hypothetical protein